MIVKSIDYKPTVDGMVLFVEVSGNKTEIAEEVRKAKEGKCEVKFAKVRNRKSLDQVGLAWTLIDRLAAALHVPPKEVYREAIRDIGGVSEVVCIQNQAVEDFVKNWTSRGLGWMCDTAPAKIENCTVVKVYYGMSVYDTKQTSTLIDRLIEECKAQGISTLTPKELAELGK